MNLTSTRTQATEIPSRAMLDLEDLGGPGFSDAYSTMVSTIPASTPDEIVVVALHEGQLVAFDVPEHTTIPVITYGDSNVLETWVETTH